MIHQLKTIQPYFDDVASCKKLFEVRKNDRDFRLGDFVALNEFNNGEHTGRCMILRIKYILDNSEFCKNEYVTLGLEMCGITSNDGMVMRDNGGFQSGVPVYVRTQEDVELMF